MPITGASSFLGTRRSKILDFNSHDERQRGHRHPVIVDAIKRQLTRFLRDAGQRPVRARLGKLLSEVTPGDIDVFFFTCMPRPMRTLKAAAGTRVDTNLTRYRSYHGATHIALTGDPRRWPNEPGVPGTSADGPCPYSFGETDAERTEANLRYLEEVITYEGPDQIAAMFIETVTGTNGT